MHGGRVCVLCRPFAWRKCDAFLLLFRLIQMKTYQILHLIVFDPAIKEMREIMNLLAKNERNFHILFILQRFLLNGMPNFFCRIKWQHFHCSNLFKSIRSHLKRKSSSFQIEHPVLCIYVCVVRVDTHTHTYCWIIFVGTVTPNVSESLSISFIYFLFVHSTTRYELDWNVEQCI